MAPGRGLVILRRVSGRHAHSLRTWLLGRKDTGTELSEVTGWGSPMMLQLHRSCAGCCPFPEVSLIQVLEDEFPSWEETGNTLGSWNSPCKDSDAQREVGIWESWGLQQPESTTPGGEGAVLSLHQSHFSPSILWCFVTILFLLPDSLIF